MGDAELVARFRGGQESAFEDLVRRHMKESYAFCLRLAGNAAEAEELSQEGFVSAYRHLGDFRGESSFRGWLYRILVNLFRDRRRSRKREEARLVKLQAAAERRQELQGAEGVGELHAGELSDVVKARVEELPPRQQEVLVLHVYQGLGYDEIAAALGCSYDDVKVNLSLARKRLRQELKDRV